MDIFNTIKDEFKKSFSDIEYKIWLSDIEFFQFEKNILYLSTPSLFKKEKIEKNYLSYLIEVAKNYLNQLKNIEIVHKVPVKTRNISENVPLKSSFSQSLNLANGSSLSSSANFPQARGAEGTKNFSKNSGLLKANYTSAVLKENNFENYVIFKENQLAFDFSQKVISHIGYINPLYIYGKVGVGKTHLMHAIYNVCLEKYPFYSMRYINPHDFVSEYTNALKKKEDRQFRINYRSLDLLFIDDIQFFMGKEKSIQEFFDIFNAIYTPSKQMIFCSDREPKELNQIDERLKSRLSSSAILELKSPGPEGKKKVILYLKENYKLLLGDEVVDYLVINLSNDIRKIKAAMKTLLFLKEIYKEELTLDYCKKNIKSLILNKNDKVYSEGDLIEVLSKESNISISDLKSRKQNKKISFARQVLMYLIREHTPLSMKEIGSLLGGKTSPTVLYAFNYVEENKDKNSDISNLIDKVLKKLN